MNSFLEPRSKRTKGGIKTKPNPTLNGVGLNDLFELYVHYYYLGNILHVLITWIMWIFFYCCCLQTVNEIKYMEQVSR